MFGNDRGTDDPIGAAGNVYEGWTSYGAGKAAVDQWVRTAGAEQEASALLEPGHLRSTPKS